MSKPAVLKGSLDFFNTLIGESSSKTGIEISLPVRHYLSGLLRFYIFSDHLFSINPSGKKHIDTLAELYLTGKKSHRSWKINLKKMGDTSLYISGFFRESLKKKMISLEYYMDMGRQAYHNLSGFQDEKLFGELAFRFSDLTRLLFHIRKEHSTSKYKDLLCLLDQYMETGSDDMAKDLIRQGFNIPLKKGWKSH